MLKNRKIAFAGYAPRSWGPHINKKFNEEDVMIYWMCASKSVVSYYKKNGIGDEFLIDLSDVKNRIKDYDDAYLLDLEIKSGCKVNDIIVKDRMLSGLKYEDSLGYIYGLCRKIEYFILSNQIEMVVGLADTALQLVTIAVCKKHNIKWRLFVSMRIPRGWYGYSTSELSSDLSHIVNGENSERAVQIINDFKSKKVSPVSWKASLGIVAIMKKLPVHSTLLLRKILESIDDHGNIYSRYTPPHLILKYLKRKINGILYLTLISRINKPIGKFCLYALQTQPESSIDVMGAPYNNQIDLIRHIARSLPINIKLYVKAHPGDIDGKRLSYYKEIEKIPGVKIINHQIDSRELISSSHCVFTISGTIGYECGILGLPVVTFGRNFYNIFPTVKYCSDLTKIFLKMQEAVGSAKENNHRSIIKSMEKLIDLFPFQGDFVPPLDPLTGADGLPNLQDLNVLVKSVKLEMEISN
jgi:hypothetical protein